MVNSKRVWAVWLLAVFSTNAPLAAPPAVNPPTPKASADELFTNAGVRHLRIEISEANMAKLRPYQWRKNENPDDRPEVSCTVREGSQVYTNVAVHLKGAAGSFRPIDSKPALTLKFDKAAEGQSFHGLHKISLNNSVQDPTYITEKLCREIFLKAGVPVPRTDHATVELNGRSLGLYVLAEGWDRQFLKRHFKDTRGNLYDPPQGADINKPLHVTSGDNPDDHS
jgi:spore coat protein H